MHRGGLPGAVHPEVKIRRHKGMRLRLRQQPTDPQPKSFVSAVDGPLYLKADDPDGLVCDGVLSCRERAWVYLVGITHGTPVGGRSGRPGKGHEPLHQVVHLQHQHTEKDGFANDELLPPELVGALVQEDVSGISLASVQVRLHLVLPGDLFFFEKDSGGRLCLGECVRLLIRKPGGGVSLACLQVRLRLFLPEDPLFGGVTFAALQIPTQRPIVAFRC